MKFLKKFELMKSNIREFGSQKLRKGDYLLIKTNNGRLDNEIVIVTDVSQFLYSINVRLPGCFGEYIIYDNEIIKQLTPEEVKMLQITKNYNL